MVNNKTTAVRIIPAPGLDVGDTVEMGGLLGSAPVMPVHKSSSADFIHRGGRIPAPLHSLKNSTVRYLIRRRGIHRETSSEKHLLSKRKQVLCFGMRAFYVFVHKKFNLALHYGD